MNKQPHMPPSRTAPRVSSFEPYPEHTAMEQGPLTNERAVTVPRPATSIENDKTPLVRTRIAPTFDSDVASPAKIVPGGTESHGLEPVIEKSLGHSDIHDAQAQSQHAVDPRLQATSDHQVSPHAPTDRVASSVIRAPKELRPAAMPYLAQLREALQMPVTGPDATTSEARAATRMGSPEKLEPVEPKQTETPRVRRNETKDAVASRSRLAPVVPSVASRQEPKRAAAKRESRIHIGHVDVRLNNASVPVIQPTPAARPVAAMSGLDTHFLSRFSIRV